MAVQQYTTSGNSLQVQGLQASTTYYFTITAYNGTTPGDSSAVKSYATQTGGDKEAVLYGGKAYLVGGKLVITSGTGATSGSVVINSSGGNILMSDGSTLTIG